MVKRIHGQTPSSAKNLEENKAERLSRGHRNAVLSKVNLSQWLTIKMRLGFKTWGIFKHSFKNLLLPTWCSFK